MADNARELDAQLDDNREQVNRIEENQTDSEIAQMDQEVEDEFVETPNGGSHQPSVPISELRKVRAEAAKYRKRLRQLESKDAAAIVNLEQIEVDENGNVDDEKVKELVKSLIETRPYLVKGSQGGQEKASYGPTSPASSSWPKPKFRTKDQVERLKHQSNEAMRSGKLAAAVRLYNQAWEIERGIKKPRGG